MAGTPPAPHRVWWARPLRLAQRWWRGPRAAISVETLHRQVPEAGHEALTMLDPARGAIEAPIRAELFGTLRFEAHGRSLGEAHVASVNGPRAATFFPRLRDNMTVLREANAYIGLQERSGHHVSPAGEWLLDNFHLVSAQVRQIADGLPRRYFRDLPVLRAAHLAGLPRIYGVAWAFVAHTDGAFDDALLIAFLRAYQETRELTLGELWALPTTLRVVLVENLRRLSERVAADKAARELANLWCDRLDTLAEVDAAPLFASLQARGVGRAFALQVMQRLHADSGPLPGQTDSLRVREAVRAALAEALPDPTQAQQQQQIDEAAHNLSVSNAISALRLIGDADWRGLIGEASALMRAMQASPIFRAERDDTQDDTLHAIERLARHSGHSELAVTEALLLLMQLPPGLSALNHDALGEALHDQAIHADLGTDHSPATSLSDNAPARAPSHWLRGAGTGDLRHALDLAPRRWLAWQAVRQRGLMPLYMASLTVLPLALTAWLVPRYALPGATPIGLLLTGLLALWPVSEAVIAIVNRLISESVPPHRLPRLALDAGIPPEHRVLVVVPVLIGHASQLPEWMQRLAQHHLANPEAHAQFALLSDFADGPHAQEPGDDALLHAARAAVAELNARYPLPQIPSNQAEAADTAPLQRFVLLHRERRWCESEQCWMGWERKRGKLEALIGWLAGATPSPFIDLGALSAVAPATPYVLTLDSDTVLPPGTLRELVGVAAHPLNRPRIDPVRRAITAGHGILQPRVATPLPEPAADTPYHRLFAGQCGVDAYSAASSEVYQDLFEQASFMGKGLLDVAAVHAVLAGRLPEGQVLSHDLLEGAMARCGGVSDIVLMEDAPHHADVASARVQRWTRGDWQLLPLLAHGRRYGLRALDVWKMADNLRRSLVAPFSVLLLVSSLAGGPLPPGPALLLVALALGGGALLGAVAGLAPSRDDIALRHFYRVAGAELARVLLATLWQLALLLQQALWLAGAVGQALWRMAVSRRGLLQWTTAAASQASATTELAGLWQRHRGVTLWATLLLAVLLGTTSAPGAPVLLLTVLLCGLWGATPIWIAWGSRPLPPLTDRTLGAADRDYLHAVARDTWRLFERHVGAESHHLPPDNVQTVPHLMVATRTSPTNIGLYLLATACARAFGWIDTPELLRRCEATLATLGTLARHRGHFLNWYDTLTLQPLPPAYVSTVDSGNLCGHLLALAQACEGWALAEGHAAEPALALRLRAVATRCQQLALEAEFGFLYDARRRLFHIGYRLDEQQLDPSFYDLLASEARLASLWAVAKGDVPVGHWGALGRPFFATVRDVGLSSWSGSMFEYLMPSLVLAEPPAGALASACRAAVHEQMAFGEAQHLPWGVSECAYAAIDHTLAYQYAPQGVPRLALRRTPPDERVVAPYATALAAMFAPHAAVANLRRLEGLNARAALGFAEALDYTPERQEGGHQHTLVSTFMAHHQGMTLVALANVLLADTPRRWGMADLRLAAVATLLQERVPREVARLRDPTPVTVRGDRRQAATVRDREVVPGETALQPTQLLSNGRYSVALRANGAGWSRFGVADVSRWRDDALRDAHGTFLYLRRRPGAAPVSLTQHPAPDPAAHYHATLHGDRVCLHAEWVGLRSRCTVWVSPEDDIELRRVELWNTSSSALSLELMSMFEVSLSEPRADEAHPAFAKLFIEADWDAAAQALHFSRRPRVATEAGLCAVHFVAHADEHLASVQAVTDRSVWLGRHQGAAHPLAPLGTGATEPGAQTTGLDPIAALTLQLTVPAHGMVQVTLATAAASSRAELNARVDRYRQTAVVERSSLMSVTAASIRLREARVPSDDRLAIQTLTTALALLLTRPTSVYDRRSDPALDRRALWRLGLSGDHPVLLLRVSGVPGMRMVRALVQGLRWWSWGGLACDLVVLNGEPNSYLMPLQMELVSLRERDAAELAATPSARRCTLTLLRAVELSEGELNALDGLARVRLSADGRPLSHHVQELVEAHEHALDARQERGSTSVPLPLLASAGRAPEGEFDAESGAFSFTVTRSRRPLRPWINVLANADFGTQVSEAAAGYTWAGNSRLHQLTPWSNDPLNDACGETFWLQDLHSRAVWNLGPGEGRADTEHEISHGPGWTTVRHTLGSLSVAATWCVDASAAVKQVRIVLTHSGPQPRAMRVLGLVEWMLGAQLVDRQSVSTAHQALAHGTVLTATQRDGHAGFGGHTAFAGWQRSSPSAAPLDDWTCDRRELFDARGQRVLPDHLGGTLSERVGAGLDPCAAIGLRVVLLPGEAQECVWLLGHGDSPEAALSLARSELAVSATLREAGVRAHWDALLGVVTVRTPDPLFDALSNRWLLYQTVACRLWARAGFYQAGGAYGFRDQLQDAMALAVVAPGLLRAQLLRAASRQFVEGDVQHWWHAPTGAGVRTHFSDDLLWLLVASLRYVEVSGDVAVLDEWVPFIEGDAIPAGAEDLYQVPRDSTHGASLYEHCARTLDRSLAVGRHGLPLMGSGDWNDGMNRVGIEGHGESVWLGWLLCKLVNDVAPVAVTRGDLPRLARWQTAAEGWRQALNDTAWDGEWFVRAFFDDGSPLGSHRNAECQIDLIAQAWAVLSDAGEPAQARHAMASAERLLMDDTHGLIRLLDPPLAQAVPSAGYIQAYPPGVRENGGQYSHAGVWALMAQAALGDNDAAWRSFVALSPAHRSANTAQATVYALEPYVMAGDVCTQAPYIGRGGWSWYTGSAAWMARAATETICGLTVRGTQVCLRPHLPGHWPSVTLWLQRGAQRHEFTVCAAWASSDIAQAETRGAQRIGLGEWRTVDAATPALHHLLVMS